MEFQLDFIEREIKKLSLILEALLTGLHNPQESLAEDLEITFKEVKGLLAMGDKELLDTLEGDKRYSNENIRLLADVFYELYQQNNDSETAGKSLLLYHKFMQTSGGTLNLHVYNRIQSLQNI